MSDVELRDIAKAFGSLQVFERISLTVPAEKYLCLIGPSGCGKTTLMRMVAGLERPDSGELLSGNTVTVLLTSIGE
jgi:ABC-type sugar transport system ATPase subunit